MDDTGTDSSNDCGCCQGAERLPGVRFNAPGLPAIDYRVGAHGQFKAALLARLSSAGYPALAGLRTRADDDFSIAWCDAGSLMLDVLSFYQERIANEAYLRTAIERRSIANLARLIGYQPSPGVAASTYLAFTLETSPGVPSLAALPVTVPVGTRAQSIPGPNEEPQTFETIEAVTARVEWNAIPAQISERQSFVSGTRELFVAGVNTQVQPGDVILIVGDERLGDVNSERWDARMVASVEVNNSGDYTRLTWADGLGQGVINPAERGVRAYVFRQRASLFGHNAPDPVLMFKDTPPAAALNLTTGTGANLQWVGFSIGADGVYLDNSYPKILADSWFLLAGGSGATGSASLPGYVELYRATEVAQLSRAAFGLSGKVTRLKADATVKTATFGLKQTLVLAQSEELTLVAKPLTYPLYGDTLALGRRDENLARGQALAISGKRQRLRIIVDDATLKFLPDGAAAVAVQPGDSFVLTAPPVWLFSGSEIALPPDILDYVLRWKPTFLLRWHVADRDGRHGTLDATPPAVALQAALKDDAVVSELAHIAKSANAIAHARDRSTLQLSAPLTNVYERISVAVCANLAAATHGEAVSEIAGSGDASLGNQRFMLKQSPLTYVSASTANGRSATLEVRVDGQLWTEVPSLFEHSANEHVYALRQDDEQHTIVQFGDGAEGARLPSGSDNLRFGYRKSLGAAGNVRAGQLTTLLGRPLGVKAVNNPVDASGGQDREERDEARRNAPLTMLTLGRAVSLQDYTDFARSFAGIAKALAIWMRAEGRPGVFLSIAGPDGAAIAQTDATFIHLAAALRQYGDPLLPLQLKSYQPVSFRLKAKLKIATTALADAVLSDAERTLRSYFSFAQRDFVQQVSLDEVMAVIQNVRGVEAVDVDELYRLDPGAVPALKPRLFAMPPQVSADGSLNAAELLTLDPGSLALQVMS